MVVVLTVLGAYAYTVIPASIFPTMSFARIDVVADVGNLPPDRVRIAVTMPLERAFNGLPSVTRVRATSAQGSAELVVEFDPSTDVQVDLQRVFQGISGVRASLPAGTNVDATIINPNSEPVLSYAFVAKGLSQTVVHELLRLNVVPRFYGVPGLARMLVVGGADREYRVELDPGALAANGLTAADVSRSLVDANAVISPGIVNMYAQRNVLVVDSQLTDAAKLRQVVVKASHGGGGVPLGALGSVRLGVGPELLQVSYDAHHAVMMNFYALPGADTVKMADGVERRMATLVPHLPLGITVRKFWDQTLLVRDSQASLRDAILLGALLAIGVILAFLRNVRMTLIAAFVIPIAIAIVIFAVGQLGQTLNLMSVGGLAVAVGLIIDDAIVVIENIARHRAAHPEISKRETIASAMRELIAPMTASTLTTVVVFLPLGLLSGVSGFFFRALAVTLATSLVVSLLLAIFVTPIIAEKFVRPATEVEHEGFIGTLLGRYEPLLRWALANRKIVYIASGCVLALTVVLLLRLPSDFLPSLDEGQFEIGYTMPVGTTLAASDAAASALERIALQDPAVAKVGRLTGVDSNGFSPMPVRKGILRLQLRPLDQRAGYDEVSSRMRDRMQAAVPAVALDFHQILEDMINDLSGAPAPIQITLHGNSQHTLVSLALALSGRLERLSGVADVFSGVNYDDPIVRVDPNGARLAMLGLSAADVADALGATAQGNVATSLAEPSMLVPVRVSVNQPAAALPGSRLLATSNGMLPVSSVASVRAGALSSDITEENGARVIYVTANYDGKSLSSVVGEIRGALAKTRFPAGYTWTIGGAYRAQQQSFRQFGAVIAMAIALVFFVMVATFRSYRLPLVILTAIPLALIGVALALSLTRTPFNVSSFMGLLLLVGLIVKNGILLIDVANRERMAGASVHDALVAAGRMRLRPIVMTTFAAIGGLLPLALGIGSGSEMEKPLAIAVIGGLSTATIFTLVAIPVLYAGFAGKDRLV